MTNDQADHALTGLLTTPYIEDPLSRPSDAVFDAVEALIAALGSDDVAPILLDAVHHGLITAERAAAYVDVAMWSGTDNGAASSKTLQSWLEKPVDRRAVELALLHMATSSCLLSPRSHRVKVLELVAARFPELEQQCQAVTQQWARLPNGE